MPLSSSLSLVSARLSRLSVPLRLVFLWSLCAIVPRLFRRRGKSSYGDRQGLPSSQHGSAGNRSQDRDRNEGKGGGKGSWQDRDRNEGKSGGKGKGSGKSNGKGKGVGNLPPPGPRGSEAEIGSTWHFGGRRRWAWMHDGSQPNGWIELCEHGSLRTSLHEGGQGSWERVRDSERICVTFGTCHHVLELLPSTAHGDTQAPMFTLRERSLRSGQPLHDRRPVRTRGYLLD